MRYKLLDKIGEGGMGVVYRALHPELGREVAIKFLLSGPAELTDAGRARFKREMEVLLALQHPSIVNLLDAGESDGKLYYVMELLEAKDLQHILKANGPLPLRAVLDILDQILDALDCIHGRGLVHRDVKPANIMLERSGRAVLMDFGLVRKEEGTLLTEAGKVLGTPRYMAPEMVRGEPAGPASDVWGLGVTAYELLTDTRPFAGANIGELAAAILKSEPPPLRSLRFDVPEAVEELIMRFLDKNPARRWGTARDALEAVRMLSSVSSGELAVAHMAPEWLAAAAVPEPPAPPPTPPPEEPKRQTGKTRRVTRQVAVASRVVAPPPVAAPSRRPMLAAAAGVALLAACGLAWMARPAPPPPVPSPEASLTPRQEVSTAERIAQLARAVRGSRINESETDATWRKVRLDIPRWNVVRSGMPSHAARAIQEKPEIARPLNVLAERVLGAPGLAESLVALRPQVSKLLMDPKLPPVVATDLLDALARLDFVDSLADYLGQKPPFGVRDMLAPALETRIDAEPFVRSTVKAIYPGEKAGAAVFHPKQYGKGFKTSDLTILAMSEPAAIGREPTAKAEFTVPPLPPGVQGLVLHIRTQRFTPQTYMYMTPPGLPAPLPVRQPPNLYQGSHTRFWFTVIVRGPLLARAGKWTIEHRRTFEDGSPMAFSVDEIVYAPLVSTE
jgi:hypothetical protein